MISGISSWSWGEDANDTDVSDFDAAGWSSTLTVTRAATLGVEGMYLIDEVTGIRDTGQGLVEAAGHAFGTSGYRYYRVAAVNTARNLELGSIIVQGSTNLQEYGGGLEDAAPFSFEVASNGKPVGSGCWQVF